MQGWHEDLYFKKRITYTLKRQKFQFDAAELLFSTHDIDLGTQFLLRNMIDRMNTPRTILDLGCGYGVIGIVLAHFFPEAHVTLVDKDLLAIEYSKHNVELNNVANVTVMGSIGVDHIPPQSFDLIASNIPGHIGDAAIERDFIIEPLKRLTAGGVYWMVVVVPLEPVMRQIAEKNLLNLQELARRPGHIIYTIQVGISA